MFSLEVCASLPYIGIEVVKWGYHPWNKRKPLILGCKMKFPIGAYFQKLLLLVSRSVSKWWSEAEVFSEAPLFISMDWLESELRGSGQQGWPLNGDFKPIHWHLNLTQIEPERCECISYCQRDFINIGVLVGRWTEHLFLTTALTLLGLCIFFSSGMSPWVEESHKRDPEHTTTNSFLANLWVTWNISPGYSWILGLFFFMLSFLMIYF